MSKLGVAYNQKLNVVKIIKLIYVVNFTITTIEFEKMYDIEAVAEMHNFKNTQP